MKIYHSSPKKLKILKTKQAKGLNKFENQKAIFLCKTFKHSALYAIGKTLKGKIPFGIIKNKLFIIGNHKSKSGYVYEVNVKAKKGPRGQYSYTEEIKNFKVKKINPLNYKTKIFYVKTKKELLGKIIKWQKNA